MQISYFAIFAELESRPPKGRALVKIIVAVLLFIPLLLTSPAVNKITFQSETGGEGGKEEIILSPHSNRIRA